MDSLVLNYDNTQALRDALDSYYGPVSLMPVGNDGEVEVIINGFRRATLNAVPEAVKDAVRAGAAFLDKVFTPWFRMVNVETLDVNDTTLCPLGQVFGPMADRLNEPENWGLTGFGIGYE